MNSNLLLALLEKDIINITTVLEAKYYGNALGGIQTTLLSGSFNFIKYSNNMVYVKKIESEQTYKILPENIYAIDGMPPERLASIYNIKSDGTSKKVKLDPLTGLPVRRGRKTNKVKELMNDRLNTLEQRSATKTGDRKTKRSKSSS